MVAWFGPTVKKEDLDNILARMREWYKSIGGKELEITVEEVNGGYQVTSIPK